jgi:hypothetical protein
MSKEERTMRLASTQQAKLLRYLHLMLTPKVPENENART